MQSNANVQLGTGVGGPTIPPGTATSWMPRPSPIVGCPLGLEYLTQIDGLKIEELPKVFEMFTGWETNNKYRITNLAGLQCFFAAEDTEACKYVYLPNKISHYDTTFQVRYSFEVHVFDNMNQEVMKVRREFKYCAGCCWCAGSYEGCSYEVVVEAPAGQVIGYAKQTGSFWKAEYDILDEGRNCVLKIVGPFCVCDSPFIPCVNKFNLMALDGSTQIGSLTKEYSGFINEMLMGHRFGVSFPVDLNVKMKATLIGALFLIDFMFYEQNQNNN